MPNLAESEEMILSSYNNICPQFFFIITYGTFFLAVFLHYYPPYMLLRTLATRPSIPRTRLVQMSAYLSNGAANGSNNGSSSTGVSLAELPKSNVFTSSLPADSKFPTPLESFKAPRQALGPRMVKGAVYTYVRPEQIEDSEVLGVSKRAMSDIGLREGEEETEDFKRLVSGNKIMWDEEMEKGIYPWAQCYGGS